MKKFGILCAGIAVVLASQAAKAVVTTNDGLAIWYDVRSTAASITAPAAPFTLGNSVEQLKGKALVSVNSEAGNGGGPGDGQILWISPRLPKRTDFPTFGLHWTGKKSNALVDQSVKSLYKYMTVQSRGGTGEVIAALGLNTAITKGGTAGTGSRIENITVTANGALWNGNNNVVSSAGDNWSITAKAVKVPVSDNAGTPVYNAAGGAVPSATPYQLGSINVTAGVWAKNVAVSNGTYGVKDSVNNLLVTRVVSSGSLPAEEPDFGYTTNLISGTAGSPGALYRTGSSTNANKPEANSGGDGLTIGTTSVQDDATIIVSAKGDFTGDGIVNTFDNTLYNAVVTGAVAQRQREVYLGDFDNSGNVNTFDNTFYSSYAVIMAGSDCSVPANCN